jgi:hypothetical protein
VVIVVLLPVIGPILWLLAGRTWPADSHPALPPAPPSTTVDDLAAIDAEIAFHEKQARRARLEAEVNEKRQRA